MWAVLVAIANLLYLIIKLPLDNPLLSLILALGWFLYLKRHELENSGPIVIAIQQQLSQIFGTKISSKELPWIETTVTHLIGK
ncbi:Oidioi.mRNA.OKI2018_I69.chr2.g5059.t1.cds [Oikopleura dioica]|uniref:Oidioi.mRNA.OKI2018_I69.chr2.g5059.t1.cds n=1 Tax=Oikopleura dioica TaxID=34765 RepID=A0ABN7T0W3_OIKDI|nr:Oidioi.mRNA.OKI2018_I69.chr2.g5059.t1.cds [Oikopleura dioica]